MPNCCHVIGSLDVCVNNRLYLKKSHQSVYTTGSEGQKHCRVLDIFWGKKQAKHKCIWAICLVWLLFADSLQLKVWSIRNNKGKREIVKKKLKVYVPTNWTASQTENSHYYGMCSRVSRVFTDTQNVVLSFPVTFPVSVMDPVHSGKDYHVSRLYFHKPHICPFLSNNS